MRQSQAVSLSVGNNQSNTLFSGNLSDGGAGSHLTKIGAGKLVLSGSTPTRAARRSTPARWSWPPAPPCPTVSSLAVGAGGTLIFDPAQAHAAPLLLSQESTAGIAAVPEPGTLALLIAGLVVGFAHLAEEAEGKG